MWALASLAIAIASFAAPSTAVGLLMGALAMAITAFATVMVVKDDDAMASSFGSAAILLGVVTFLVVSTAVLHWYDVPMTPGWR